MVTKSITELNWKSTYWNRRWSDNNSYNKFSSKTGSSDLHNCTCKVWGNQRKQHTQLSFLFIFLPPIFDFVVNLGHQNNQPILAPPPYIDTIKSSDNSRVCIENNYTFVDSSGRLFRSLAPNLTKSCSYILDISNIGSVTLLWQLTQCQSVSTFESEMWNSLSVLEPHSTDSLSYQHRTNKLCPKITLHFKVLCESIM